jgi:hypothetical protein
MVVEALVFSTRDAETPIKVPIYLDPGAQLSFITTSLAQTIKPQKIGMETMDVTGFGGQKTGSFQSPRFSVLIQRTDGGWEQFLMNQTPKITPPFGYLVDGSSLNSPGYELNQRVAEPQILLGVNDFLKVFVRVAEFEAGIYKVDTILGPVFAGERSFGPESPIHTGFRCCPILLSPTPSAEELVHGLWSLEALGIGDKAEENDDDKAVELFNKSISRDEEGRYEVKYPWKSSHPPLSDNFSMAFSRLNSLWGKLRASPELLSDYQRIIGEQIKLGIIEPAERTGQPEHFLPHQPVLGTKTRVVHDASSHSKGSPSLNDCLLPGPNLLPDLASILIRFRCSPFPVLSDVEKAFLMIGLHSDDREFAKFLWLKNPTLPPTVRGNLLIFRFRRIAFGVVSSPFILLATLKHHLLAEGQELGPSIEKNLYMDNVLLDCASADEAREMAAKAQNVFAQAKMRLCSFVALDQAALSSIPEPDRLQEDCPKMLGLKWELKTDSLRLDLPKVDAEKGRPTRRGILGKVASFFDPLGLGSPLIVKAKVYFQSLWGTAKKWDELLDEPEAIKWHHIILDWIGGFITVPRLTPIRGAALVQLHIFSDSGLEAFATAVYLRSETIEKVHVNLVYAKSRLRPRKMPIGDGLTIPKLELLGLLIGTRAKKFVLKALEQPIEEIFFWVDSQIVLSWISSTDPHPVFVSNRLIEIRKQREANFRYVRSEQNPADYGTRGATALQLQNSSLWFSGPSWLEEAPSNWPNEYPAVVLPPEETPDPLAGQIAASAVMEVVAHLTNLAKFSTWNRLVVGTAGALRYLMLKMGKSKKFIEKFPKLVEIGPDGISYLPYLPLARNSLILSEQRMIGADKFPGTFLDPDGIRRLATRLGNADQPLDFKFPIILPNDRMAYLIMHSVHISLSHSGVDATLCQFFRTWWVPKARRLAKRMIKECPICLQDRAVKFALPPMPPWPKSRVCPAAPFRFTGLDYLGPTRVKGPEGTTSTWVLLLTCLSCRAVHLEAVSSMTAEDFLLAFRRFVARRGLPSEVISDNGSNFLLARQALQAHPELALKWKLIPQLSPWAGGVYERIVGLVKPAFRRCMGKKILNFAEFSTLLVEIEGTLNSRPITQVSTEADAQLALRPIDFLSPGAQIILQAPDEDGDPAYKPTPAEKLTSRWVATTKALNRFWERWSLEYLLLLRSRVETTHQGPRSFSHELIQEGHVVLVEKKDWSRNLWPLARVVKLHGQPGQIRSAEVRMPNGRVLTRPINMLVPLEVLPLEPEEAITPPISQSVPSSQPVDGRSKIIVGGKRVVWAPIKPTNLDTGAAQ